MVVGWRSLGLVAAAVLAVGTGRVGLTALVPGGGKAASDCYGEFDVRGGAGSTKVTCTDGDPDCDGDGLCQGVCTFSIAVCLNQTNVPGCTPAILKKPVKVTGAPLAVLAPSDASAVCAPATDVAVALRGKRKPKRGKKKLRLAVTVAGTPPRDADTLTLTCEPRQGACPTTTTTITGPTTTTTLTPPDATALLGGNRIAAFSTTDPSAFEAPVALTGVTAGETLVTIDRRPQNGYLYGLGFNSAAGTAQLYAIDPASATATPVGTTGSFVAADGVTPAPIAGTAFDMDFNPTVDRIRVVTAAGQNFRMTPDTGAFVDGNLGGAVVTGINMDGPINGATVTVQGAAYINNQPNETVTVLYTLDATTDVLCIQNPPNNGTQTACSTLSMAIDGVLGFDIAPGVDATGSGLAVVKLAGQAAETLVRIDLTNGAVTPVGPIGSGGILGIAIQKPLSTPLIGLSANGTQLVRFSRLAPSTTTTVTITGVVAGETIVGIDFRPTTGQLFGLGISAAADNATLFRIDPQTGVVTAIGAATQIAFVDSVGADINFPAAGSGWGFDFNPTVDRIRVVTGTGLTFRVNPVTGAPIDGNTGQAGIQLDSILNGGSTSADGVAYTNGGGLATVTTLYALDGVTDSLYIVNPPNAGTLTMPLPITFGGVPLNFSAVGGFDIPGEVRTTTLNAGVTAGAGLAALTVGGTTRLFSIDLPTGAATNLGAIGTGATALGGLAVGQTAVR